MYFDHICSSFFSQQHLVTWNIAVHDNSLNKLSNAWMIAATFVVSTCTCMDGLCSILAYDMYAAKENISQRVPPSSQAISQKLPLWSVADFNSLLLYGYVLSFLAAPIQNLPSRIILYFPASCRWPGSWFNGAQTKTCSDNSSRCLSRTNCE